MPINREENTFTLTAPARMSFVNLLKPRAFKAGAELKFSATFLFQNDHPDLPPMKAMIGRVFRESFPGAEMAGRVPLKLGDKEADKAKARGKDFEVARGHWVLNSSSGGDYRPVLSVSLNGTVVDLNNAELLAKYGDQFYSGSEAYAAFFFKKYEITETNFGVTAYLQNVYSLNKGGRLGGAASGAQRFSQYAGHLSAKDPTVEEFA